MSPGGLALLGAGAAIVAALFLLVPPLPQDQAYHQFADTRSCGGIANCGDVLSNLPFAVIGLAGLLVLARARPGGDASSMDRWERWPYAVFFAGTALTAAGSAYYHLAPDNARLFWDRLPMAIGFAGLLVAVLAERVGVGTGRMALAPLLAVAVGSVIYWAWTEAAGTGDLRPYLAVQFGSLAVVVALLACCRSRYTGTAWLATGIGAYALAKALEIGDHAVFAAAGVSGHTLKHLAAAAGIACVVVMLRTRHVVPPLQPMRRPRGTEMTRTL